MLKHQFKLEKTNGREKSRFFYFSLLWGIFIFLSSSFNTWRKEFKIQEDFPYQAFLQYLQLLLNNPVEYVDWFFITLLIIFLTIFLIIHILFKYFQIILNITPNTIYWSLQDVKVYTIAKKDQIEYIELVEPKKFFKSTPRFLQLYVYLNKNKSMRFFNILNFSEDDQKQITDLCQKYYGLNPEIQNKSKHFQIIQQTKVSPRILYLLLFSVVIGALAFITFNPTPSLHIAPYPWLMLLPILFFIVFIPSYIWVKIDIPQIAEAGTAIASFFLLISLCMFLPNMHQLYNEKFGQSTFVIAELTEITDVRQNWQIKKSHLSPDFKFFVSHPWNGYNPKLEVGKRYKIPVHYHFYDYSFSEQAFFQVEEIK